MDTILAAGIVLTCMSFAALISAMAALAHVGALRRKLDTVERHTLAMDARITEIELDLETRP